MIDYLHWHSLSAIILALAYLLDFIIADPRWLPHPVVMIGRFISLFESLLRKLFTSPNSIRFAGVILTSVTVLITFLLSLALFKMIYSLSNTWYYVSIAIFVYITSTTISAKGLIDACLSVINEVNKDNLQGARQYLSMIVGRDTENLTKEEVLKATIETLSENLSDGVVAPTFYYLIGGVPLAMTYKAINTLDSMVGYKNERYKDFGWASARLDDVANFIPARITGLMIVIATFFINRDFTSTKRALITLIRDGQKHPSPNSGIPEAAMAGALGVRLGGASSYGGVLFVKPYIGLLIETDYLRASKKAISIAKTTILLSMLIFTMFIYAHFCQQSVLF
ncbi:MAG: adenosylcobinamide-phosphate synthase CbiB [Thermodesulfovibrionales bacterium]|nr:adenosylcobinamide-phosphate synthase CbiB [Thermodesulfovibrionales bacterium]